MLSTDQKSTQPGTSPSPGDMTRKRNVLCRPMCLKGGPAGGTVWVGHRASRRQTLVEGGSSWTARLYSVAFFLCFLCVDEMQPVSYLTYLLTSRSYCNAIPAMMDYMPPRTLSQNRLRHFACCHGILSQLPKSMVSG